MSEIEPAIARYQELLAAHVELTNGVSDSISMIGGVDVAYSGDVAYAAACLFSWPELAELEYSSVSMTAPYPYKSGFFVLREGPPVARAVHGLDSRPQLLFVNGGGIDHPRGFGLASHLGVVLGMPTVGVTRKPVTGKVVGDNIVIGTRRVGRILRDGKETAYISPGHMLSVDGAFTWTKNCTPSGVKPLPLKTAHMKAAEARKSSAGKQDE